jgi:hypothetical protein
MDEWYAQREVRRKQRRLMELQCCHSNLINYMFPKVCELLTYCLDTQVRGGRERRRERGGEERGVGRGREVKRYTLCSVVTYVQCVYVVCVCSV